MNAPHGLQFERASGCLIVRMTGKGTITQKKETTFKALAEAVAQQPIKALLVDMRKADGPYTFMDRYQIGELAARYLADVPIGALLFESQTDPQRIGQLVAVNRGAKVEIFIDEAAAFAWLKKYQQADLG
jgi:hypothetical protein